MLCYLSFHPSTVTQHTYSHTTFCRPRHSSCLAKSPTRHRLVIRMSGERLRVLAEVLMPSSTSMLHFYLRMVIPSIRSSSATVQLPTNTTTAHTTCRPTAWTRPCLLSPPPSATTQRISTKHLAHPTFRPSNTLRSRSTTPRPFATMPFAAPSPSHLAAQISNNQVHHP